MASDNEVIFGAAAWNDGFDKKLMQASVDVLHYPGPEEIDWDDIPASNSVWPILTKQARAFADARFLVEQPDAVFDPAD